MTKELLLVALENQPMEEKLQTQVSQLLAAQASLLLHATKAQTRRKKIN